MIPPWAQLLAIAALLAAVAGYGHHMGADSVQAKWDAKVRADKDADDAAREVDRLQSHAAATVYETQKHAAAERLAKPSPESAYAMHATICPPAGAFGKPLELGDVPVGAAVLQRLRDAGADF